MRLAVLADVHSNLEALAAVLRVVNERGADAVVCLGDVVGYGADAQACVDLVRASCGIIIRGNHDEAVATGEVGPLPKDGQAAALHNREHLDADALAWLGALPFTAVLDTATLVHATPQAPERWLRADSFGLVQAQFGHFDTPVCLAGHMHVPSVVGQKVGQLRVRPGGRFFVVCGSVGQPRDNNPRAAVSFFDTAAMQYEVVRVPYHVEGAVAKIRAAGLPESLGNRLKVGR